MTLETNVAALTTATTSLLGVVAAQNNLVTNLLAQVQYVPTAIASLLIDGQGSKTLEVGASAASVGLSWSLTGAAPTLQSINGVGTVPVGTLAATANGPFTTNQTFTLTVGGTSPNGTVTTTTASVGLSFQKKRYWGVSTLAALDSVGVLALGSSEFSTGRSMSVSYNATGGKYPYYAYPAAFGPISGVTVNGLPFSDFSASVVSVTNSFGVTENYNVVRFNSLQNGSNIGVNWS